MEVLHGNHLAHHRSLNTDKDPGFWRGAQPGEQRISELVEGGP